MCVLNSHIKYTYATFCTTCRYQLTTSTTTQKPRGSTGGRRELDSGVLEKRVRPRIGKGGYGCPYCNKLMKGDLRSTINHAVGTSQGSIKNGYAFRAKHPAYAEYLMRLLWGFREVRTLAARTDALLVLTMLSTTLCYTLLVNIYGRTMCTSTTKWCLLLYIWKHWTKVELC